MYNEIYNDMVIEHFKHPRNIGRMNDADGIGIFSDPGCGDSLTMYIKVVDGFIDNISFLIHGCAAAIATGSMTTELAKGKTIDEAIKITKNDILESLGGLPENKKHYSNFGLNALRSAIEDYYCKMIGK